MDDLTGKYISHSQHKDQQCGNDQYDFFYCCKCVHEFFVHFHTLSPFVYFFRFQTITPGFWIKKNPSPLRDGYKIPQPPCFSIETSTILQRTGIRDFCNGKYP